MSEFEANRIVGTNVFSNTSPITYKALMSYSESVKALNGSGGVSIEEIAGHFDRAIQDIYKTLAEIEMRTTFNVIDES